MPKREPVKIRVKLLESKLVFFYPPIFFPLFCFSCGCREVKKPQVDDFARVCFSPEIVLMSKNHKSKTKKAILIIFLSLF